MILDNDNNEPISKLSRLPTSIIFIGTFPYTPFHLTSISNSSYKHYTSRYKYQDIGMEDKTEPFDRLLNNAKNSMVVQGYANLTEVQCQNLLNNRIKKFYSGSDHINVADEHFKPRIQPVYGPGVVTSDSTAILFGIDFLNKQALRQMFEQFNPQIEMLDQSNCMLRFANYELAKGAIKQNALKQSVTICKLEQDEQFAEENNLSLKEGRVGYNKSFTTFLKDPPKEWIQLNPYTYRHFYKSETLFPDLYNDYLRKLHIRFATSRECEFSAFKASYLNVLQKCQAIWESEAKRNKEFKQMLIKKKEAAMARQNRKMENRNRMVDEADEKKNRSRSRESKSRRGGTNTSQNEDEQERSYIMGVKKDKLQRMANGSLNVDISYRSQASEVDLLIHDLEDLGIAADDPIDRHADTNLSYSAYKPPLAEIPYKLYQPSQLRDRTVSERFDYRQYVEESLKSQERTKKVKFIDLTE